MAGTGQPQMEGEHRISLIEFTQEIGKFIHNSRPLGANSAEHLVNLCLVFEKTFLLTPSKNKENRRMKGSGGIKLVRMEAFWLSLHIFHGKFPFHSVDTVRVEGCTVFRKRGVEEAPAS